MGKDEWRTREMGGPFGAVWIVEKLRRLILDGVDITDNYPKIWQFGLGVDHGDNMTPDYWMPIYFKTEKDAQAALNKFLEEDDS